MIFEELYRVLMLQLYCIRGIRMKKRLRKIIIAAILFIFAIIINLNNEWLNFGLYLITYIIIGGNVLKKL